MVCLRPFVKDHMESAPKAHPVMNDFKIDMVLFMTFFVDIKASFGGARIKWLFLGTILIYKS